VQSYSDPQTINRYSYCVNNPLKYVDPTGHFNVADDTGAWNEGTVTAIVVRVAIQSGGIGIGFASIDDSQFAPQMPLLTPAPEPTPVTVTQSSSGANPVVTKPVVVTLAPETTEAPALNINWDPIIGIIDITLGVAAIGGGGVVVLYGYSSVNYPAIYAGIKMMYTGYNGEVIGWGIFGVKLPSLPGVRLP